tara:strand:+ start:1749 stop:2054 length:306 start_codon:yes stop_codon:yes gene_type:complete
MRNRNKYTKRKVDFNKKRYYTPLKYPEIPLSENDLYVVTIDGDRLDLMAQQFYNDIRLWWIIANANPDTLRRDSYSVPSGLDIRVPREINKILKDFEKLNK